MSTKKPAQTAITDVSSMVAEKRLADKNYMSGYSQRVLKQFKSEKSVKVRCSKVYANMMGTTWTFLLNTIPITVRFDGTVQEFPESVATRLLEKFAEVTEANVPKVDVDIDITR